MTSKYYTDDESEIESLVDSDDDTYDDDENDDAVEDKETKRLRIRREYYAKNRVHINELVYLSRYDCACGSSNLLTKDKLKHERTNRHKLYVFENK